MRTIGLYQPFASLMFHGKIETRWVKEGKKPPFPLGKYLIYSTIKSCDQFELFNWSGPKMMDRITEVLSGDISRFKNKTALGVGDLVDVRPMVKEDEEMGFVKFIGYKTEQKDGVWITKRQWSLVFENMIRIDEFEWKHGKQGVGLVPETELKQLQKYISPC